jgi:GT2 family glycosyltransferase
MRSNSHEKGLVAGRSVSKGPCPRESLRAEGLGQANDRRPNAPRIVAVMATRDRLKATRNTVETLLRDQRIHIIYIFDDGSTDGTCQYLKTQDHVELLVGDGSAYWAYAMSQAMRAALRGGDWDYILALNDDTCLYTGWLETLLETAATSNPRAIAVGAIQDPDSGALTYGGFRVPHRTFPMTLRPVEPAGRPVRIDTLNANLVLIPRYVVSKLGVFHGAYPHAFADLDYGLRATRHGIPIVLTPRYVGTCRRNRVTGTWQDIRLSRRQRLRRLGEPKGVPPRALLRYHLRTAGPAGFLAYCYVQTRLLLKILIGSAPGRIPGRAT